MVGEGLLIDSPMESTLRKVKFEMCGITVQTAGRLSSSAVCRSGG